MLRGLSWLQVRAKLGGNTAGRVVDNVLDDLPRERKSERHDRIARGYVHRVVVEMGVGR